MISEITGYRPGHLYYTFGNSHIYNNHIEQVKEQLTRSPFELPRLEIRHRDNIDDFTFEDFNVVGYQHHPAISGKVSV